MADHDDRRYDEPRRYKTTRTRPVLPDDAEYVEETTFIERGKGPPPRELISRPRDDSDDDLSPTRQAPPRRARRRAYDDSDDSEDLPAAAAGYAAGRNARGRGPRSDRGGRRGRDDSYSARSRSSSPERKKSGIEGALASIGLAGVAAKLTGKNKSRAGSSASSRSSSRSDSRPGNKKQREWAQAAQAALIAGAIEAFRTRNAPGPWTGDKAKRIATAAIASGGIDKLVDRDPDRKSKIHLVEAVLGGLAANRLANGPVPEKRGGSESGSRSPSRSRSRARSRSVFSRYRSKSRRRNSDSYSDDSRDRGRGQSTAEKVKDVGAGVVLAGVAKSVYDRFSNRKRRSSSTGSESDRAPRNRGRDRSVGPRSRSRGLPENGRGRSVAGSDRADRTLKKRNSSEDSLSTTDMENRRKKMRGKEFLTAGLATIATIHAAHGVYQSMEASDKRHKLVAEGEMTPEEARKKRSKAWLQDAAAVGIAALGIKGAYSEWKEMNEQRHEVRELEERREARKKRREKRLREMAERGGGRNGGAGRPGQYQMSGGAGYPDQNPYSGPYR